MRLTKETRVFVKYNKIRKSLAVLTGVYKARQASEYVNYVDGKNTHSVRLGNNRYW